MTILMQNKAGMFNRQKRSTILISGLTTKSLYIGDSGPATSTSSSFTPSNNSLLIVIGSIINISTVSSAGWGLSGGGLTWTKQYTENDSGSASYNAAMVVYTAPVTTGASMTTTLTHSTTSGGGFDIAMDYHVLQVTGHNISSPLRGNSIQGTNLGNASYSMDLPSAPLMNNLVVAARAINPDGGSTMAATPGSDFTEISDTASAAGYIGLQSQYRKSSIAVAVSWVDVMTASDSDYASMAIGFEISAE